MRALSLDDLRESARARLPRSVFAFVESGSEDEQAHRANHAAFAQWALAPRSLVDVSRRDARVTLFGREYSAPFGIAPMGGAAVCGHRADLALAEAAAHSGVPFVLSGASTTPVEDVMARAPGSWFQAYLSHDPDRIDALLDRLEGAGVEILVITTDVAVMGNRENALRAGFSLPPVLTPGLIWDGLRHPRWLFGCVARTLIADGVPRQANFEAEPGASILARKISPGDRRSRLGWDHIRRIRTRWKGSLALKGILSSADARLAADHGVDGVILSNHGGRQLSSALPALHVVGEVRAAAPGLQLIIDGGVRRGGDVLKAKALGADMVMAGRPFLYAAALDGRRGVEKAIMLLKQEVDRDLALLGCSKFDAVGLRHVRKL